MSNEHQGALIQMNADDRRVDKVSGRWANRQAGKVGYALLWLLGIPLPILLVIYLIRGH